MAIVCPAPKSLLLEPIVCRCVVGGKAIQNNRTAAAYLGRLCMALTGPCFFFIRVRGRRLLRFVCARAHCCCCLEKRKPYSFFGQKKERDGRTARVWRTDDWPCAEEKVVVRCCSFLCVVVVCRLRLAFNIDALLFLLILLLPPIRKWATTNKKERIWFFFYRRLSLND